MRLSLKKLHSKKNEPVRPSIQVIIGYKDVYDDYETVNIQELLKGIPTLPILHFVSEELMKVVYSFSDPITNTQQVRDIAKYLPKERKKRVWEFAKRHSCGAFETYGTSLLYGLSLLHFEKMGAGDNCLDLCLDEQEKVYKALLYCNQRWTDEVFPPEETSIPQKAVLVDLPIVEFKTYKDFLPQLYKVCQFFIFCETDTIFQSYLPTYYSCINVKDWKDYVRRLLCIYMPSIEKRYITLNDGLEYHIDFFDNYAINSSSVPENLWDGHNALNYLRNHFLYKVSTTTYLLLNPNFLIDKLYQGMRFEFGRIVVKNKLLSSKRKPYKDLSDFNSVVGTEFSEPHLLYTLLEKIYSGRNVNLYTGQFLKNQQVPAEPDLYLRIDNALFLFEFKDVTMNDIVKYSNDISIIQKSIEEKMCRLTPTPKGAGQLRNTIEQIFVNNSMGSLDANAKKVDRVYQIIMTTDRSYSAIGMSNLLLDLYNKILLSKPLDSSMPFVANPIIIEFDTFFKLAYRLHKGVLDLNILLWDYLLRNENTLSPFSSFIDDCYKQKAHEEDEIKFLYGDVLPYLIS